VSTEKKISVEFSFIFDIQDTASGQLADRLYSSPGKGGTKNLEAEGTDPEVVVSQDECSLVPLKRSLETGRLKKKDIIIVFESRRENYETSKDGWYWVLVSTWDSSHLLLQQGCQWQGWE
jgi:hypothetical protein